MDREQMAIIEECAATSLAGTITFPEVVGRLLALGVERYHADYSRHETTYYFPDGDSHVVKLAHPPHAIGATFAADGVAAAVQASQRGKIKYVEFLQRTMAAGCVGYFVQITGRQVLYFGRKGEVHVERFPAVS